MKKIVRLTESDLVRIVKRVISEQTKDGPVIPKNTKIEIDDSVIQDAKKLGISLKKSEDPVSFLKKLNQSPLAMNAFYVESEGVKFRVYKLKLDIPITDDLNVTLSCEPFNKAYGLNMCRVSKKIPFK
jgi:hypothetical protein